MHSLTVLALASTFVLVLAQNITETSVIEQSADFNLVIQSRNKTLNGKLLGACHDGAANECLCVVDGLFNYTSSFVNFQFNTTNYICAETNSSGTFNIPCNTNPVSPTLQSGSLTWWLDYTGEDGPSRVSQPMILYHQDFSNVALAQISFDGYGYGTYVAFDNKDMLNILAYQDDRLEPVSEELENPQILYRWYICLTYVSSPRAEYYSLR